ncbi:cuticle protein 8-like [Cherax quadricarinatus]|uniref:cuticle protein 8-like n=1 Tax=Cherax quadricarinatus TaxID=27406 RepID=UPI002377EFEA|nr:cuticle protein 8-like [Cherax quadricarinatus]
MNTKVFLLLGLVAFVSADKRPSLAYGAPQAQRFSSEEFEAPKYGFDWAVRDGESGNDFAQQETRDNENTKGSFTVQLPDGRLQTVNYYVDGDSGFIADVQYQGEARYPDSSEVGRYSPPAAPSSRYGAP